MEFFLKATGDTTDRSAEIMTMLQAYKVCVLTPGTYYVSGVKMPDGTAIFGMGEGSQVVLCEDVEDGCAISMASCCALMLWPL